MNNEIANAAKSHANGDVIISQHELSRLQSTARAWETLFMAMQAHNRDTFDGPGTGIQCALRELKRLQAQDKGASL